MSDITISCDGVLKLFESLDPNKVPGPDSIPTKILKVCAKEVSPYFTRSLATGELPDDWLKAKI